MKKIIYTSILVCILLIPSAFFAQTTYTSIKSGPWSADSVWSPQGIPGASDNVYIDQQTIVTTDGHREVAGFSILVGGELILTGSDGSLTITDNGSWGTESGGGIIRDASTGNNGLVTIANGAVLVIEGNQFPANLYGGARLVNEGTVRMVSGFGIWGQDGSVIENRALFEIEGIGNFGGYPDGGIFINTNAGTLLKSGGGDCNFNSNWEIQNIGGNIDVQSGSITFNCDGIFNGGTYNADAGSKLHFDSQNFTFEGTLSGAPEGIIEMSAGVTANTGGSGVTFDFQGTGLTWSGGTFMGAMVTIPGTGLLQITGTSSAELRGGTTLLNLGTIRQTLDGTVNARDASIVDNQSLWEIVTDNVNFSGIPDGGTFKNSGIFRHMGSGTCTMNANWNFQNLAGGIIDAANGVIDITNLENGQGGIIEGVASVNVHTTFTNDGIIAPGNSPGMLTYIGNYLPSSTGVLEIELGGLTAGSEHDQLAVTGNAVLDGTIDISLVNGYIPSRNDSFVVLTTTGIVSDTFLTVNVTQDLYLSVQVNPNNVTIVVDSVGDISSVEEGKIAAGFKLNQNYPNPFYSNTTIKFEIFQNTINQGQNVSLKVYDLRGKEVADLMNRELSPGTYEVNFDGSFLPDGVYFSKLMQGNFLSTKKMILMK